MPNSNAATTTTNQAQGVPKANGQQIPINHQYQSTAGMDVPQGYHTQPGYGSPSGRQQQQFSSHFPQGFGFDPDIDNMFNDTGLRSHLDRMRDPFGTFGSRKRSGNKNPLHTVPSYYDDDDADFPQFGSLGRRRAGGGAPSTADAIPHDDFFERLPSEFRHLIPDGFGIRRTGGSGAPESPRVHTQQPQYYQTYVQPGTTPPQSAGVPQSQPQTRTVCDAAIQTEDPSAAVNNRSEVDGHLNPDSLNQHGLRNTVDMGVKAPTEGNGHDSRSHSAPPQQPQNQNYPHEVPIQVQHQQPVYHSQGTGTQRNTPPPAQQQRPFPPNQQPPQFPKSYYPPTNQQQPPAAPQTPGGTYIRTIPIFVEGRSEPLISNKEIPQQTESQSTQSHAQAKVPPQTQQQPHQHQQNRPTPINTQQQTPAQQQQQGPPPATPHTMDSINKIQDIQREVLHLMTEVEKFGGTRGDKEYAFLDEMLTRNLLKLDTIDTQGKESIRLARKEAIKCIQASINVLEAKAEENAKTAKPQEAVIGDEATTNPEATDQPNDVSNVQEPIPLPPPESLKSTGSSNNVPADESATATNPDDKNDQDEASPAKESTNDDSTATTTTASVSKSGSNSSAKSAVASETKTE